MQSIDARRPSSQFEQHLFDARRRALSAGLRWYWVINLIALVFLLTRFYIYRDAHLVLVGNLPWSYKWQLFAMIGVGLLLPLGGGAGSPVNPMPSGWCPCASVPWPGG